MGQTLSLFKKTDKLYLNSKICSHYSISLKMKKHVKHGTLNSVGVVMLPVLIAVVLKCTQLIGVINAVKKVAIKNSLSL